MPTKRVTVEKSELRVESIAGFDYTVGAAILRLVGFIMILCLFPFFRVLPGGMFPAPGGAYLPRDGLGRSLPARVRALLPARQVALLPGAHEHAGLLVYEGIVW